MPLPVSFSQHLDSIRYQALRQSVAIQLEFIGLCPLYYVMMKDAAKLDFADDSIEVPFVTGTPSGGVWFDVGDALPDGQEVGMMMGYVKNKYCVVGRRTDRFAQLKRKGHPNEFFDEMQMQEHQASQALRRTLHQGIWTGTGGKAPESISYAIEKSAPSAQTRTITGLNKATRPDFRNRYVQMTQDASYIAPGSRLPNIIVAIQNLVRQCTVGNVRPDILVTNKDVFATIARAVDETPDIGVSIAKREMAHIGFECFDIMGIPIIWDTFCPDDSVYCLKLSGNKRKSGKWVMGDGADMHKVDYDSILEDVGKYSKVECGTGISLVRNKNVIDITFGGGYRSPRSMVEMSWVATSLNLMFGGMKNQGVLGSDNGVRLTTGW